MPSCDTVRFHAPPSIPAFLRQGLAGQARWATGGRLRLRLNSSQPCCSMALLLLSFGLVAAPALFEVAASAGPLSASGFFFIARILIGGLDSGVLNERLHVLRSIAD